MRNAVERIFGVVKRKYRLLVASPEFNLGTQARIPPAIACLFNFVRVHNPATGSILASFHPHIQPAPSPTDLRDGLSDEESKRAEGARDVIAKAMFVQYQEVLLERGGDAGDQYLMQDLAMA